MFNKFLETLESKGIKPQGGTFVEVPRRHNAKEENAQIKKGEGAGIVFGEQKMWVKDATLRSIGFARAE